MVLASSARAIPRSWSSGRTVNGPKKPTLPQLVAKLEPTNFPSSVAPKRGIAVPATAFYVNAKDMLSLSLLQARLVDLKLPIKIVEGE